MSDASISIANRYLLHLMGCALVDVNPRDLPGGIAWPTVYERAVENSVSGLAWGSVRHLGSLPDELRNTWEQSATMTLLRSVQFEAEREAVLNAMREAGLSYVLLKGAWLSALYPAPSMRSMFDNDILYGYVERVTGGGFRVCGKTDEARAASVERAKEAARACMSQLAYIETPETLDACDTHFFKPPFLNFELHHALMEKSTPLYDYYENPWLRARPREGDAPPCEMAFSVEDAYVYLIAHAYKHGRLKGMGVRIVADVAALLVRFENEIDFDYVNDELIKLHIDDFERPIRGLAHAMLHERPLTAREGDVLDAMIACGTYGSDERAVLRRMESSGNDGEVSRSRLTLLKWFLLPSDSAPSELEPFVRRPLLRPLFPFARIGLFLRKAALRPRDQLGKLIALLRG